MSQQISIYTYTGQYGHCPIYVMYVWRGWEGVGGGYVYYSLLVVHAHITFLNLLLFKIIAVYFT